MNQDVLCLRRTIVFVNYTLVAWIIAPISSQNDEQAYRGLPNNTPPGARENQEDYFHNPQPKEYIIVASNIECCIAE